jgi:hypothetical protein
LSPKDKHVVLYIAQNGHIMLIDLSGGLHWYDLTQLAAAPVGDGLSLAGFLAPAGLQQLGSPVTVIHVFYTTPDSHIHHISGIPGDSWSQVDLTIIASAPPVNHGALTAYIWETQHTGFQVAFSSFDGHVYELYATPSTLGTYQWHLADLSQIAGAPVWALKTAGYAWYPSGFPSSKQVVYETYDAAHGRHFHELYVRAGENWKHADLSVLTGC